MRLGVFGVAAVLLAGCQRAEPPPSVAPAVAAPRALPPRNGFKPIGGIEGENPSYDRSRAPDRIVAALGIQKGQRVADIGAGRG